MRRLFLAVTGRKLSELVFDRGMVQEKSSRVYAATLLVRTLIIKNIFIHQNKLSFSCSFVSVSSALLAFSTQWIDSIVLINNLHKSIHSKDLNCSMSPSFIALILLSSENKSQTFLLKSTFQIVEITSMLDKCSPVIVVEPATTTKTKVRRDDSSC
jgi:hypothetical protein